MKKGIVLIALCLTLLPTMAAKVEKLSIVYDYVSANSQESEQEARMHAFEQAKQQALEDKFGVDVSRIVVNQQQEVVGTRDIDYQDAFYLLGGSVSRGQWVETTVEEVIGEPRYEGGEWHLRVRVEGTGRLRKGEPIDLMAALIHNEHDRESRQTFYDGDDLYLRFSSPVSGSLLVYLVDNDQQAYCLLPYENSSIGYYPVEANKEYLFFSEKSDAHATEYTLNTERGIEQNVVYVVFSPNALTKAKDKKAGKNQRNEQLPRQLSYKEFLDWLSRNQTRDERMVVKPEVITIKK